MTEAGDDLTDATDPTRKLIRQIVGAVVEAEKAPLVAKLSAARQHQQAELGAREGGARRSKGAVDPFSTAMEADHIVTLNSLRTKRAEAGAHSREGKPLGLSRSHGCGRTPWRARIRTRPIETVKNRRRRSDRSTTLAPLGSEPSGGEYGRNQRHDRAGPRPCGAGGCRC